MKKVLSMILTLAFIAGLSSCGRECVCKGKEDGDKFKIVISKKGGENECKGCGIGACFACVCKTTEKHEKDYVKVCSDGPVFPKGVVAL